MLVVVPAAERTRAAASISRLPGVTGVQTADSPYFVSADGRTAVVQVLAEGSASAPGTVTLLSEVRAVAAADRGVVGGETAEGVDANAAIAARLPLVAAVMLVVVYALLLVTFRSVVLPLKAIVVNGLSVAATYGILVLLFARGGGYLQNFVPSLLLAVLFSLSTDYEVFLLSRVREEYLVSGDNAEAVATGAGADRTADHWRRGADGGGVRRVRLHRADADAPARHRPGNSGGTGRHGRPAGPCAGVHAAGRPLELVAAVADVFRSRQADPGGWCQMNVPVLVLVLADLAVIGVLPRVFFKRGGRVQPRRARSTAAGG
jgi:hypothetical protein